MITLIVLIALFSIFLYLTINYEDFDVPGFILCCIFGVWIVFHSVFFAISSYSQNLFVEKRNAFEETLKNARESGNDYETAAIVKDVAQWNVELAENKFYNKTFYIGQYIDDRVEYLEPIK